ncbi:hypothetical protein DCO48_02120 [Pseudomonas sp. SDI]|nr:hypothetical protein DCO48_02120 [Pseudomonas sp. SDI]
MQPILQKIEQGDTLHFAELHLLYDAAEVKLQRLLEEYEELHQLKQLQEDCADLARQLQVACLALRRANLDAHGRQRAREVLEYQMAYQKACLQRSMISFVRQ